MGLLLPSIGPLELVLILAIVLLLFGTTKLPALGKGIGEAIRNFKQGVKDTDAPSDPDKPKA